MQAVSQKKGRKDKRAVHVYESIKSEQLGNKKTMKKKA